MDSLTTHPSTAMQAKAFTAPSSLSYPGGTGDLTPPSEKDGSMHGAGGPNGSNGPLKQGANATDGTGVTPTTPATTPGAQQAATSVSGIVPTLQ